MSIIRVAELFAGVGGFRVGLEAANRELDHEAFEVVFSNQWEPSTRRQHASDVYTARFGSTGHSNVDIGTVDPASLPVLDLVVGGFPCQDYSVATTLQRSGGLAGKKGVLWWEIHRILRDKDPRPPMVFLENVDRLLKSPANRRGRDFAVMLASLADLGYSVEWRVINAADYGMPQRRRRVFILAYLPTTPVARDLSAGDMLDWLSRRSVLAKAFPCQLDRSLTLPSFELVGNLVEITNAFNLDGGPTPFADAGALRGRTVYTAKAAPTYTGPVSTLGSVLVPDDVVPPEYFIDDVGTWQYLKAAKSIERTSRTNGHRYRYAEGALAFPDRKDLPSRTIITGEGGRSPSRFKHVVETSSGRLRRLVPVELERLNMFPDDHTAGVSDGRRAFLMGNALVTGVVRRAAVQLANELHACSPAIVTAQTAHG